MTDEDKKEKKRSLFTQIALGVIVIVTVLSFFDATKVTKKEELTVSAAMSLKGAFVEIGSVFEKSHPKTKVIYNFGSSGLMAQQIRQGSPADVFASADKTNMDALIAKGLIDEKTVKDFAKNQLVVISANTGKFHSFDDLAKADRVAMGDPMTVPAGKYAEEALQNAQILAPLRQQKKLIYGENVRQVLTYVETKNADAGLVYATDTAISHKVSICFAVPDTYTQPIVYPIGIPSSCSKKPLAQQFIDLVTGPEGQKILQQKGFLK
ncbi:MAG TPA: molybdate ABC transporter substrate-binding protein [Trichormus sp.]|jgi:molybdate transport system substrate-binding protein